MIFDLPETFETKENVPTGSNEQYRTIIIVIKGEVYVRLII